MIIDITKCEKQREQWWQTDPYWRDNPDRYFPNRNDVTILPADDPRKLCLGWKVYETVGIVVINDYAIFRIDILPTIDPDTLIPGQKYTLKHKRRPLTYEDYTYIEDLGQLGKCFAIFKSGDDYTLCIWIDLIIMNPEDTDLKDFTLGDIENWDI